MGWRERVSRSVSWILPERRSAQTAVQSAMSLGVNLSGVTITERSIMTLAAAYACINVISTDLASLPLVLYRTRKSGGRDEVTDHDAAYRLRWSCDERDEASALKLRQDWQSHVLGWGNGYTQVIWGGDGSIKELKLLHPGETEAHRRRDGGLYYKLGDSSTLPASEVMHLAGMGFDGVSGFSPARLCKQAFSLGLATEAHGAAWFGNGSRAGGFLKTAKKLSPEAKRNLRESFEVVHQGVFNAARLGILEEGLDYVQGVISNEDSQFLATRQFQTIEVCRIYRVPPHKVGDYSQAHLANVEASNLDYILTTIRPWAVGQETVSSLRLLTQAERRRGLYFEHQLNALLRGDAKTRVEYYQRMRDLGALNPDEIRNAEGYNPLPDGIGRVYLVPVNMTPLERMTEEEEEEEVPGNNPPAEETPAEVDQEQDQEQEGESDDSDD